MKQDWDTYAKLTLLESLIAGILNTDVHVFSDSVLCFGNKAEGDSTSKWEKLCNETYCHSSFRDNFELSRKSVRFRFHVIHGNDSLEIITEMRNYLTAENVHPKGLRGRVATQEKHFSRLFAL